MMNTSRSPFNCRFAGDKLAGFLVLLLAVVAIPAHAQTLPPPTSDDQLGLQPYQSYHGGDIDVINLSSGTLNLNLPFLSYPQRGELHFGFNLFYNDQSQHITQYCPPKLNCTLYWGLTLTNSPLPVERSDVYVGLAQQIEVVGTNVPETIGSSTYYYGNFALQTADGSKHPLANLGTMTRTGSAPAFYEQYSGPWESLDATGWRVPGTLSSSASPYTVANPPAIGPDGVYYSTATAFEEDPNGNMITVNAGTGTVTDSLGRQIPPPPTAKSTSNTSTSGCPQTPLTVDHAVLWSVPGLNGNSVSYKFCYAVVAFNIPPMYPGPAATSGTWMKLQSIVLPNGTTWNFAYNDPGDGSTYNGSPVNYGTMTQITLPTGGTISYTYTTFTTSTSCQIGGRWVASRTVNANDGTGAHTWNYSYTVGTSTTVTDPLGNYTVHTFGLGGICALYETQAQYYQSGGTLLKTVNTTYDDSLSYNVAASYIANVVPGKITTVWPNNKTSQVTKSYDSGFSYTDYLGHSTNPSGGADVGIYGKMLSESDYDYGSGGPGPVLKTTNTNYLAFSNPTYLTENLLDLVSSQQITDSGGTQRAYTTYGYDEYGVVSSGISTQHDSSPADGSNRGNQTSVHEWENGTVVATTKCNISVSNGYLVSYKTYLDTGMTHLSTDPCGSSEGDSKHTTNYSYSTSYVGGYLTSITNPLSQTTSYTYDLTTGVKLTTTDPNNQTTSTSYDPLTARPIQVSYPDNGQTNFCYSDIPGYSCSNSTPPFDVVITKKITSGPPFAETLYVDDLGRLSQTQLTSDPSGVDYTVTTYDADGRRASVTNPYRSASDGTYGVTSYTYDGLNRTTLVTDPDGSKIKTAYCANTTLVTDEAGHWRRSTADGLGRLIEVDEPNSPTATVNSNGCPGIGDPVWITSYTYDALSDLASVVQGGSRNRSFTYDSLKRLTQSTNPESGSICYGTVGAHGCGLNGYDADGNVVTKTDARSISITYSYDVLNRLIGKTYSNGDPSVSYTYDQTQSGYYNVGRRTSMTDAAGSETLNYDQMGRELTEQRITNSVTKNTTYTYNLDGSLATLTYPSGRVITYTYNAAAQPISAVDTVNNIDYATNAYYAPPGGLAQIQKGSNLVTTHIYNDRLQPCWIFATTGTALPWQPTQTACTSTASPAGNILDLKYNYNSSSQTDNGNVTGITNNRDTTRSQSFAYDQVNRISSAQTSSTSGSNCWGEAYGYDQWANLTTIGAASGYSGCTQESLSVTAGTTNQLTATGYSYDALGNMLTDASNTYVFNAESEIETAASVNYTYDGDGDRVEKSNGKIYWYGAGAEILDESDGSGNFTDEYVFFGGKRVAHRIVSSNTVYYYAEDLLGTSRTLVQAGQTSLCYDADFYPFGGERDITTTCSQNYKFESKERDAETGNDDFGARYYSSRIGRWLSSDWSAVPAPVPYANLTNPQTLNLYAMASDNPETFADLNGHYKCGPSCRGAVFDGGGGGWAGDFSPTGGGDFTVLVSGPTSGFNAQQRAAQNQTWSGLSSAQQALVQGGQKAWNSLSAGQRTNFSAITYALQVTILSNGAPALSEVKSVTSIGQADIGVTWSAGAKQDFEDSGFSWRLGYGHKGENGLSLGGSAVGLHLLFGNKDAGVGHVHIDYRGIGEGHFKPYDADVRAVGPEHLGGRPISNYERYKSWFGPIPGYSP